MKPRHSIRLINTRQLRQLRVALVPVFLLLTACATSPAPGPSAPTGPKVKSDARPFQELQKGMTGAQVRQLLGIPAEIKPFRAGELDSRVWVYHGPDTELVAEVPAGTREVPQFDAATGVQTIIKQPIYEYKPFLVSETFELLMVEDQLIEWKRTTKRNLK